jgi:hypothetical protein
LTALYLGDSLANVLRNIHLAHFSAYLESPARRQGGNMRILVSAIILGLLAPPALAASSVYELYLLACDGLSDCQRVANLNMASDGRQIDTPTPGVGLHVETLLLTQNSATIRTELNLFPSKLYASAQRSPHGGQVTLHIESTTLHPGYFSPIAVFSSSSKIFQLWGRLADAPETARNLALK